MAFRNIPKKFDIPAIVDDLKNRLIYSSDIDNQVVPRIAEILGVAKRTAYDVLDGRIKLSLDYLHAAVIATDGDPEIRKYLEPDGFILNKMPTCASTRNLESETTDIILAASTLIEHIRLATADGKITKPEKTQLTKQLDKIQLELNEARAAL